MFKSSYINNLIIHSRLIYCGLPPLALLQIKVLKFYLINHFNSLRKCKKFSCHINLYCKSTKEVFMKFNSLNIMRNFIYWNTAFQNICTVLLHNILKTNVIFSTLSIWLCLSGYWSKEESGSTVLFQPIAPVKF